ncbi:MAG: PDZ domain-containing protein [Thermoanaerobaculia bacterium]|nr:PDZ domain-containing protein [Thermoanaerobaculia bacterium]
MHPRSISILVFASLVWAASASFAEGTWPQRVLITNDNGIEDRRLVELARAMVEISETYVVAATSDRSGTSNLMPTFRAGVIKVERRDIGEGIKAWALEGYPADCVLFGVAGPMRDHLPDLVISGINGGPNLGDDWFGSGTIGAARTAAYMGFPAIAVSGLNDETTAISTVVAWVVELARSEAVRRLRPPQYLTVSLPKKPPREITGLEVTTRARGLVTGRAVLAETSNGHEIWRLEGAVELDRAPAGSDVVASLHDRIAIVPMRVDEYDPTLAAALQQQPDMLPPWSPPVPDDSERRCRSGLGAAFDDAEDDDGKEWGVIIEKILSGGRAEDVGLRKGDVVINLNGVDLAPEVRSTVDPVDRFVAGLEALGCGDTVTLTYVRDGDRAEASFEIPEEPLQ